MRRCNSTGNQCCPTAAWGASQQVRFSFFTACWQLSWRLVGANSVHGVWRHVWRSVARNHRRERRRLSNGGIGQSWLLMLQRWFNHSLQDKKSLKSRFKLGFKGAKVRTADFGVSQPRAVDSGGSVPTGSARSSPFSGAPFGFFFFFFCWFTTVCCFSRQRRGCKTAIYGAIHWFGTRRDIGTAASDPACCAHLNHTRPSNWLTWKLVAGDVPVHGCLVHKALHCGMCGRCFVRIDFFLASVGT